MLEVGEELENVIKTIAKGKQILLYDGAWDNGEISLQQNVYNFRYCLIKMVGQGTFINIPIIKDYVFFRGLGASPFTNTFSLYMLNASVTDGGNKLNMTFCREFSIPNTNGSSISMNNHTVGKIWGVD